MPRSNSVTPKDDTMRLVPILTALLILAGCASTPDTAELTEAEHYRQAHKTLEKEAFLAAIEELEEVRSRFPYGEYAEQVQLDLIYAHYRNHDYPAVIAAAERFIRNYPNHQRLDYPLYMKGLANFYLERGLLNRMFPRDRAARDMQAGKDAFSAFRELVNRFPDSEYAPDARARMLFIRNNLAEHELQAARYYARRGAHIAAANRARHVVVHYQHTPAVPEALAILTRAYQELGQNELAGQSGKVLRLNWPDSDYLNDDGKVELAWWPGAESKGLLSLLTFDLL